MTRDVPFANRVLFWTIAIGGALFDLATKQIIFARVGQPGSPPVSVVRDVLELRTSHNTGALWGMGKNLPYSSTLFAGLSIAAALAICYWLFIKGAAVDRKLTACLGLIMAGAIGNCYDRLAFGYVRDFMDFHVKAIDFQCAIFNFADNMLVIGSAGLMLMALRPESPAVEPSAETTNVVRTGQTS